MDPAFDLRNLDKLPSYIRKRAKLLLQVDLQNPKPSNRFSDFAILGTLGKSGDIDTGRTHQEYLLPVYWRLLEPRLIPTAADLDAETPRCGFLLKAAALSIIGVQEASRNFSNSNPHEPFRLLWDRIWPWMRFIHSHYSSMPDSCRAFSEERLLFTFLNFACFVHGNGTATFLRTPGITHMVFRAWAIMIRLPDSEKDHGDMVSISLLLSIYDEFTKTQLDEALAGCGGTLEAVARLVASQVDQTQRQLERRARARHLSSLLEHSLSMLGAAAAPVAAFVRLREFPHILGRRVPAKLLVKVLTGLEPLYNELDSSNETLAAGVELSFYATINILTEMITANRVHLYSALESGFITALAALCQGQSNHDIHPMPRFIKGILQPCTLFSRFAGPLQLAVAAADSLVKTPEFRASKFIDDWDVFVEMAIINGNAFSAPMYKSGRQAACDNLACGAIKPKAKFMTCSGCAAQLYCGEACQRADWKQGHRSACKDHKRYRNHLAKTFTSREIHDIRAVMKAHSEGPFKGMFTMSFITEGPRRIPSVLSCDFAEWTSVDKGTREYGPRIMSLMPEDKEGLDEALTPPGPGGVYTWADLKRRAHASEGRLALHIVRFIFGSGGKQQVVVLPFRASSSFVRDEGHRIWKEVVKKEGAPHGHAVAMQFAERWTKVELPRDHKVVYS
ncbi:MYND-type domain-containing protein [Mycena chlorophos]|uniref:phytol kinase n=1 Tax=Mycena chlorophos TaxID=658473 RepID=A0A8H6S6R2_MYCCL|nr:MYND-type domain-containing protein [Mycena chlorophos]